MNYKTAVPREAMPFRGKTKTSHLLGAALGWKNNAGFPWKDQHCFSIFIIYWNVLIHITAYIIKLV